MTRQRAIYLYCLECAGGTPTEVTFCQLFDCPLWPFRCGYGMATPRYKARVKGAFERNGPIVEELRREQIDVGFYIGQHRQGSLPAKKSGQKARATPETEASGDEDA